MAGYRETFGANVDYAYQRGVTDLTGRLQQGASMLAGSGKGVQQFASQYAAAKRSVKDLGNTMSDLRRQIENATDPKQIRKLTAEFESARKSADSFRKSMKAMPFDAMTKGLGSVTKGLISFNANILKMGFDFLINSIKRVYELQERWTRAIGGFNMKLGGMTKGMAGATKAAVQWSSTIRGLTNGSIEEGIQMFGEFTMAIGRTVKAGDGFSKLGIQMARGFGIGGQGAGQILKVFENIGMSADDSAEAMKVSIKAANEAGIPVNMLAEDLVKSTTYMARFGKEGQKTLIQGAAWARKYDIALDQLRQSVEGFDMFDEAAKSASKLNTAFGTMINSMDLMMEDDPAKRLDMIRQQMLAQGLTYDKLSPKQRRYFSETLKLSEEQTAALLDSQNAGESYADFQAKAEKKQKQELAAKAMMQKMLVKTAQTMYAFGDAFDRVTKAIAKAIRPLLEVLGLAKKGDKQFASFGSVMENITQTVISFFESLAENDRWMGFMKELGKDLQRAGSALKEFVMSGRAADLVGDIAKGMQKFYTTVRDLAIKAVPMLRPLLDAILFLSQHIDKLALAWAGMKAFKAGKNLLGDLGDIVGGGRGGGGGGRFGKVAGMLGKSGIAGAIGAVGGGLIGGKGAGIGSAIGGIAGSFLGPIGTALGPIVGGFIGKGIEKLFGSEHVKSKVEIAREGLAENTKETNQRIKEFGDIVEASSERARAAERIRQASNTVLDSLAKKAKITKEKEIQLSESEAKMLSSRAKELTMFSKNADATRMMLESLGQGSKLTAKQLETLMKGAADYETTVKNLKKASQEYLELEEARLQTSVLGAQKTSLEAQQKYDAADLELMKAELKKVGGPIKQLEAGGGYKVSVDEQLDHFEEAMRIKAEHTNDQGVYLGTSGRWSSIIKGFDEMKKLHPKEFAQLELTAKIRKRELDNANNEKKLNELKLNYAKQEAIINLRAQAMRLDSFGTFKEQNKELSGNELFKAFVASQGSDLAANFGESGLKLLSENPDFQVPKMATGGVVTRPTAAIIGEAGPEAVIPLSRMRENLAAGSGGTTQVVTQIAEVTLDGQKVGRALVRSTIRGRN